MTAGGRITHGTSRARLSGHDGVSVAELGGRVSVPPPAPVLLLWPTAFAWVGRTALCVHRRLPAVLIS